MKLNIAQQEPCKESEPSPETTVQPPAKKNNSIRARLRRLFTHEPPESEDDKAWWAIR